MVLGEEERPVNPSLSEIISRTRQLGAQETLGFWPQTQTLRRSSSHLPEAHAVSVTTRHWCVRMLGLACFPHSSPQVLELPDSILSAQPTQKTCEDCVFCLHRACPPFSLDP